ncbi:MAG: PepSY domain-containing protein [Lysobacteraceae bacterium]|nr:MAG: PepSY domain-containing protein [Xanthomonadaceae bacterium]
MSDREPTAGAADDAAFDADGAPAIDAANRPKAYRAVWRWHFYLGLLVAPVLLLLATTGALYLFDTEIERAWYREQMNVVAGERPATAAAQEARVRLAFPRAELVSVAWPRDATHVSAWTIIDPEAGRLQVLVDPWRARVIGTMDDHSRVMYIVSSLHGELMLGAFGDRIVELVASCTLLMMVTGLYLWWPKRWRLRSVLIPRWGAKGRAFWRDLHAVPSALLAVGVIFLVLSGLPWSGFWGDSLAKLGTLSEQTMPTPNFRAPPVPDATDSTAFDVGKIGSATVDDPHALHRGTEALPWAIRQSDPPSARTSPGRRQTIGLAQVMEISIARGLTRTGPRLRVFYPEGPLGVFTVSLVPARAQEQRTLYIDPRSGEVLGDIGWKQYSPLGRAVEFGVMTHLGQQFGEVNRWLMLVICLGIIVAVVAGLILWWRRRPVGGFGAPDARGGTLPRPLLAGMVVVGVLFPFAGIVLLVIGLLEKIGSMRTASR